MLNGVRLPVTITVLQDVTLCHLVDTYRNSRGNYCLIHQNRFIYLPNESCKLKVLGEPQIAVAYARLFSYLCQSAYMVYKHQSRDILYVLLYGRSVAEHSS